LTILMVHLMMRAMEEPLLSSTDFRAGTIE